LKTIDAAGVSKGKASTIPLKSVVQISL